MSTVIADQIVQGIGASPLVPCSLSLLTQPYPDSLDRAKAIAIWSSWGAALVVGPLAGGVLITMFDRHSILLVNVRSASRGSG
jgi:DHA2 family methylenomycin A resistance protein-like MFS transporter